MKKAFGPSANKTAPLKSSTGEIITDRSKQMRGGLNTTRSFIQERILSTTTALRACQSWMNSMIRHLSKSSAWPLIPYPVAKFLGMMVFHLKSSKSERPPSSTISTNCCVGAGRMGQCHKTCATLTLSPSTKTRVTVVTATILHVHVLPWNLPAEYYWEGLRQRSSQQVADTSLSCVPRIPVWLQSQKINHRHDYSLCPNSKRNVVSKDNCCTSPSST